MKKAKKRRVRIKSSRRACSAKSRGKKKEWTVADFVGSVWGTMEEQARKNPHLKMIHARLEPEWNRIIQKITDLLEAKGETDTTKFIEEICKYGERAVRPLIDALLKLR